MQKYGPDNFIIHTQSTCMGRRSLDLAERHYIATFETQNPDCGYNIRTGGQCGSGYTLTREKKIDISAETLRQYILDGLDVRDIALRHNCGTSTICANIKRKFDKKVKDLRVELLGRKMPQAFSDQQSRKRKGNKHSSETRRKQAEGVKRSYIDNPDLLEKRRQDKKRYWESQRVEK
jgi:hypothetical protein